MFSRNKNGEGVQETSSRRTCDTLTGEVSVGNPERGGRASPLGRESTRLVLFVPRRGARREWTGLGEGRRSRDRNNEE